MKKILIAISMVFILFGCSKEESFTKSDLPAPTEPIPAEKINDIVESHLYSENRFRWDMVEDQVLWSALVHSDSMFSIGYMPKGTVDLDSRIHEIDIESPEWVKAKNDVVHRIIETMNTELGQTIQAEELEYFQHEVLPYIVIKTASYKVVEAVRQMEEVRYADAMGYGLEIGNPQRSGSGCGTPNTNIDANDYTPLATNGRLPWNYNNMKIPQAWAYSKGSGITIGLIDTGVSDDQDNLGSNFAVGQSTGRSIQKYSTYYTGMWWWRRNDGPHDQCGHGTSMAGLIAAPLGTPAVSSVGVAYKSSLVSYRGTGDVVVNSSNEKQGVTDALIGLGNNSSVRIISMSIGNVFYSGQVADGVRYAYGKGKLIMAAAGTSTTFTNWVGVIFPAWMSETVAVTGVVEGVSPLEECSTCHYGSETDFAVIMQRNNHPDRTSLTLTRDYFMPINFPSYIGGSSCATATAAGIAGLVWARNPSQSRTDVINRLKIASQFYPARDSDFGWGVIDALIAVNF